MFNILLSLMVGVIVGWNFHAFFLALEKPNIIKSALIRQEINLTQTPPPPTLAPMPVIEPAKICSPVEKNISEVKIPKEEYQKSVKNIDKFYTKLNNNHFSDAMVIYLNAQEDKLPPYRTTLKRYFEDSIEEYPQDTIRKMLEYIELEPEHKLIKIQLSEFYTKLKKYPKAIDVLIELKEQADTQESEQFNSTLFSTSKTYIDHLKQAEKYQELIAFLEQQIELDNHGSYFTLVLAEYYVENLNYTEAGKLLKEIEYDDSYGEKSKNLLEEIHKKEANNGEYPHRVELKKRGSHFYLNAKANEEPLTLLIDTGATYTSINQNKLSTTSFTKMLRLQTAGGEISEELRKVDSFSIGDIEVRDFQVTASSFPQENADGLLGMNFLKHFQFKIDQENEVLYLSEPKK